MAFRAQSIAIGYGIRVSGRDLGVRFSTAAEAKTSAQKLLFDGYIGVEIFEHITGQIVEIVAPEAA